VKTEIEVKVKIDNTQAVVEKLRALGCEFSQPTVQEDTVYTRDGSIEKFGDHNKAFLRIRVQDDTKVFFTLKKDFGTADGLVKIEHEVAVDSVEEIQNILRELDFKSVVYCKKMRQKTHYKNYEICIDEVEDLGSFIEVEEIADSDDAPRIQKEMMDFLATISISDAGRVFKGYDLLMLERRPGVKSA
jgi:adenylate cyclase, class 2